MLTLNRLPTTPEPVAPLRIKSLLTTVSPHLKVAETASKHRALRVFLVEDSLHIRDLLLDFLHDPGKIEIVGFADTEKESVAAIFADPVDVVIVDLKLREGSGMGVIKQIREAGLDPAPNLIVFTNHPFPEVRQRAMQLGANSFFDKSAEYEDLRDALYSLQPY